MDHRELLKNFYLFTDATANDLRALEAIGEPRVYIAGDRIYREERGRSLMHCSSSRWGQWTLC